MERYRYIIFDMDGTLVDSARGVTTAVAHALRHLGVPEGEIRDLNRFVGLPIKDAFIEYYGFAEDKALAALSKYREKFTMDGLYDNLPFPGIRELLQKLKSAGHELLVATCKPESFARIILDRHGLLEYFVMVGGGEFSGPRQKKEAVLQYVLNKRSIADPSQAVTIGDRKYDAQAARALGTDFIGVLYGYGSREEMEREGASRFAEDTAALESMLLQ